MIKPMKENMIDDVMQIWLDTNISAHSFIEKEYWQNNFEYVKKALQWEKTQVYIYEQDGEIQGFVGVVDGSYIAGIFVKQQYQSQGIGKKLIDFCKNNFQKLKLDVYKNNESAVRFYKNNGFLIEETNKDSENNQMEYVMLWEKHSN